MANQTVPQKLTTPLINKNKRKINGAGIKALHRLFAFI
jgi:hypothetical protein